MKTYPFLAVFICLCVNTAAQEYSFKYGKITPDELRMTLYEPEPDAPAVFIYDDTDIHYSFGNSIQLLCYRTVKIKVFKDEGVKWGDVAIDFGNYQLSKEVVSRIDAAAYNLVDGKTVKTQLKRQNIFEEVLDEHTKRLKFSIPEVRAGTVIEYRYLLTSDFIGQIPDVDVQHAIPVVRSTAQISIPEYFTHHIHTRGYLTLPVKKELENGGAAGFSGFSYTNTKYICNIDRVPSLRKEPYVWHLDDFRAGLEFEINGLEIPGSLYKSFTRTWADVYESLDRSEFGRYTDIRNPFKDEVAAIVARNADDERRQLHEILKFVQSRIAWDGTYRLTPESSPHAAVDKGRGDSGSINFILAAALRDAGFKPEIILLNPRSAGRLPLTHATDRIRTFVLRTKLKSGETVYLDATDLHSDVNVLPTQLLVDHARLYSPEHPFENWINLSSPAQSVVLSQITARLTEEGGVGMHRNGHRNQSGGLRPEPPLQPQRKPRHVRTGIRAAGRHHDLGAGGRWAQYGQSTHEAELPQAGRFGRRLPLYLSHDRPLHREEPLHQSEAPVARGVLVSIPLPHHRFADAARRLHRRGTAQIATPVRLRRRHRLHDAGAATGSAGAMPVRIRPVAHHLPRHRIHRPERILRIRHGHVQQPDRP